MSRGELSRLDGGLGTVIRIAGSLLAGYAAGNLPTADLAVRLASPSGADLRSIGSHNPGALNVGKELGARWGVLVSLIDIGKGVLASQVGRALIGAHGANVAAAAAVAGHCYPLGRSGGKGVATSIGQVVGTFPRYLPVDFAVAIVTAAVPAWKQKTYAATAVASSVWIGAATLAWLRRWPTGTDTPAPWTVPAAAAVSSVIIAKRFADTPLDDGRPT